MVAEIHDCEHGIASGKHNFVLPRLLRAHARQTVPSWYKAGNCGILRHATCNRLYLQAQCPSPLEHPWPREEVPTLPLSQLYIEHALQLTKNAAGFMLSKHWQTCPGVANRIYSPAITASCRA